MRNSVTSLRAAGLLAALSATAFAPLAAQNATASDVEALREQIRLLDQKLRVLERNSELAAETASAEAKKLPKLTASEGRLELASADGANSLRLRGLVQADARFYLDDANAAQDRFLLRRARLIFEGKFSERFNYVIQPEFAGSTVSILDANVSTALTPDLGVRFGRFKTPVGLEQLQSDPVAFFNERSIATNLAPNRDVGVEVFGSVLDKTLGYQVSLTNGVIDGGNSTPASDNLEGDFTVAARLFATPFANNKDSALKGLGFGLGAATGNYDGAQLNAYRTDGQQTFFAYGAATTAAGRATVLSPQAYFYSGPFGVLAEYFHASREVSNGVVDDKLTNKAFNLSVGYVLTGEDASYRGVTPKNTFNPSAGTWGAFELVARFAQVDIDDDTFPTFAGANNATEVKSYGLGLNWYLSKTVRAGFNVFKNEYKLAPGAAPAAGSALFDDELAFISRVQVSF
jgi:phosphate-selective porin OprO and OprP